MVNISTNINKTKESLNSDGEHFHQYQQNKESLNSDGEHFHQYQQNHNHQQKEQLPLTSTHWTYKNNTTSFDLEIQVLAWDRHKNVAGLNRLIIIPPTLDNWISYGNTY